MKKNNHHYSANNPLKVGDIVHIHHTWQSSVEIVIREWQGSWKTLCIYSEDNDSWDGKVFTLEKDSDRVFKKEHSKLLRILYGYSPRD